MERNEMIEVLISKAKISREEAEEVLQKNNWDVLDSIIYLEREGKIQDNGSNTVIEVVEESKEENKIILGLVLGVLKLFEASYFAHLNI